MFPPSGSGGGYLFSLPNGGKVTGLGSLSGTTFTGQLQCDPAVYGGNCSFGGTVQCGTDIACANYYGGVFSYGNGAVYVKNLPVLNIIRVW
jgi:hypothetical protein